MMRNPLSPKTDVFLIQMGCWSKQKTWNLCDCWWWIEKCRIWVFASFHLFQGDNIFGCVFNKGFGIFFNFWGILLKIQVFAGFSSLLKSRLTRLDDGGYPLTFPLNWERRGSPRRERAAFRRLRHSCAFHYFWLLECIWLGSILFLRHCMSSLNLNLN